MELSTGTVFSKVAVDGVAVPLSIKTCISVEESEMSITVTVPWPLIIYNQIPGGIEAPGPRYGIGSIRRDLVDVLLERGIGINFGKGGIITPSGMIFSSKNAFPDSIWAVNGIVAMLVRATFIVAVSVIPPGE